MNGDSRASVARTPRCLKLKDRRNAFNFASDPRSPRAVAGPGRILSFPTIVPLSPATWLGAFHAGHDESVLQLEKSCPDFRPICQGKKRQPNPSEDLAAPQGFEPRYADPESAVLPLNEGAASAKVAAHLAAVLARAAAGSRARQANVFII